MTVELAAVHTDKHMDNTNLHGSVPNSCEVRGCREPVLVGVNGRWLCPARYAATLKAIREALRRPKETP